MTNTEKESSTCPSCGYPARAGHAADCNREHEAAAESPEKIRGFDAGITHVTRAIENILKERDQSLISIAGRSGSGKSEFSNILRKVLIAQGIESTIIQSDSFYKDEKDPIKKELDLDELHSTINALRNGERVGKHEPNQVLIVEGLQTVYDEVIGQKPDFRAFVERDLVTRMNSRLLRDEKSGFRSVQENLDLLVNVITDNPEVLQKFEGEMDMSGVDMVIENDYLVSDAPRLTIENNELFFSMDNEVLGRVTVNDEQVEKLKGFGIV